MRLDIKQLIVNLKQLKIDNELAQNLDQEFKKVETEEEAKKGVPTGEISYNKCYVHAAKQVLWMNDKIKDQFENLFQLVDKEQYKSALDLFEEQMKDWDRDHYGSTNDQQDCGEFVEKILDMRYQNSESLNITIQGVETR